MELSTEEKFIDAATIKSIYRPRDPFSNKGDFGYACLLAGSYGMMGAAVLAARACLRSGIGKLTCYIPERGNDIMQVSVPEAMTNVCGDTFIKHADDIEKFDSIGIGPGIGLHKSHKKLLQDIFANFKRPIVDADALNFIAQNKKILKSIPAQSIITPHPKEFERLFGKTNDDIERKNLALEKAHQYKIYIVLKGHHTLIATPDKKAFLNSTGNAGMATAGSGDVLTGILTGLAGQNYSSLEVCLLGVYLHGLAGDIAAKKNSQEALIAGDIIDCLGEAFNQIQQG